MGREDFQSQETQIAYADERNKWYRTVDDVGSLISFHSSNKIQYDDHNSNPLKHEFTFEEKITNLIVTLPFSRIIHLLNSNPSRLGCAYNLQAIANYLGKPVYRKEDQSSENIESSLISPQETYLTIEPGSIYRTSSELLIHRGFPGERFSPLFSKRIPHEIREGFSFVFGPFDNDGLKDYLLNKDLDKIKSLIYKKNFNRDLDPRFLDFIAPVVIECLESALLERFVETKLYQDIFQHVTQRVSHFGE